MCQQFCTTNGDHATRPVPHWYALICNVLPPGGVEPLPYGNWGTLYGFALVRSDLQVRTAQSFRHGFAVPPPFTQGRLWCDANVEHLKTYSPSPHQSALPTASPQGEAFGFCKPAGAHRTLASPFGGGVRAKRRTERVSQQRSHRPSQSASLTALPKGEPRNFCKSALPQKRSGRQK